LAQAALAQFKDHCKSCHLVAQLPRALGAVFQLVAALSQPGSPVEDGSLRRYFQQHHGG